ncbi:hypothetical protein [Legionella waltersii]|uniref:Uncharacterized protein n=1 Tax=Legionella waltersii TaxID=66969 RepID=A0A0W1ALQ7_9GAMM|nr:hypothetical protein [Legionella waltersii]KTD82210.1 hypothetical protein Lwal_0687 [Legionella waltersii]SNV10738.1 Uncharacterised protein [Legionella waltersii]
MYSLFGRTGHGKKADKNFLEDNRAQRLLISILDGSFEKQVQTWNTSNKTGFVNAVYLVGASTVKMVGLSHKRETVDAVRDVSETSINLPINVIEVLGVHQRLIPERFRPVFNYNMTILTAILKIEQAGFANVLGDSQEANDAYTAKLIEIIRVLIREKGMIPSEEDIAIMRELGGAFSEFIPPAIENNVQPEPTPEPEAEPVADVLENAVDEIIRMVQGLEIEPILEPEAQEQITLPRGYFHLWDKLQKALRDRDNATLSAGLQSLTERFTFKVYAGALISVANDFDVMQSQSIKTKLLDLAVIVREKLEQQHNAEDALKPQNFKGSLFS